jgi:hypothetical protein
MNENPGIVTVAAIIKPVHLAALASRADYTWDTLSLTVWVAIEQYLSILAACIPKLTPLFISLCVGEPAGGPNQLPTSCEQVMIAS